MSARLVAELGSPEAMLEAVRGLRASGFARIETYSPYHVHGTEEALGLGRSRLPRVVFAGAVLGAVAGLFIQYLTNVVFYPLNAGGRPAAAWPAFIAIAFETLVMGGALAAVLGFLVSLRLPELWAPIFEVPGFESATRDGFWVEVVVAADVTLEEAARILESHGAERVLRVVADAGGGDVA